MSLVKVRDCGSFSVLPGIHQNFLTLTHEQVGLMLKYGEKILINGVKPANSVGLSIHVHKAVEVNFSHLVDFEEFSLFTLQSAGRKLFNQLVVMGGHYN